MEEKASSDPVDKTEETRLRLLKMKEELSRAKDELAQAKNDVERAKLELTVAGGDCVQSLSQSVGEEDTKSESVESRQAEESAETRAAAVEEALQTDSQEQVTNLENLPVEIEEADGNQGAEVCDSKEDRPANEEVAEEVVAGEVEANADRGPHLAADETDEEIFEDPITTENDVPNEEGDEGEVEEEEEEEPEEELSEGEVLDGEREEGDGEESENAPAKPLDDDEDKRNPQYIPKRGGFYEHDDRGHEAGEETKA